MTPITLPETIDNRWIDTLTDAELADAELELRERYTSLETAERERGGVRYDRMRGSPAATSAWVQWSMVRNATRSRGVPMLKVRQP
jgi:hypothetical protein